MLSATSWAQTTSEQQSLVFEVCISLWVALPFLHGGPISSYGDAPLEVKGASSPF